VYRRKEQETDFVRLDGGNLQATTFQDPFPYANGQIVYYRVRAADAPGESGNQSDSTTLKLAVNDGVVPTVPALSAVTGDGRISLSWTPSSDASGIAGYEVWRRTNTTDPSKVFTPRLIRETVFEDVGLTNGQTYYYQVRAIDVAGNAGGFSCNKPKGQIYCDLAVTPKDLTPPGPPRGFAVGDECEAPGAVADTVLLRWDRNPPSEGVYFYEIHRSNDPTFLGFGSPIATVAATASSFNDIVDNTTPHYYALRAVDGAIPANKSALSEVRAAASRDRTRQPQPLIRAASDDGVVTLLWRPVAGEGEYRVYRKLNVFTSCSDYRYVGTAPAPQVNLITFVDAGVANGVAYDYAVTSVVGGVESNFSRRVLGVPLEKPIRYHQCSRWRNDPLGSVPIVDLQWDAPSAPAYQPALGNNATGVLGYLKGYRLYFHQIGNVRDVTDTLVDNSPIRAVVGDPTEKADVYLLRNNQPPGSYRFDWQDPRYYAPNQSGGLGYCSVTTSTRCYTNSECPSGEICALPWLTFSPEYTDTIWTGTPGVSGAIRNHNCLVPKTVYKVFADGTWLTRESQWPDYFDPFQEDPRSRCGEPLKEFDTGVPDPTRAPLCSDIALPAPSMTYVTAGAACWSPQQPADGSTILGYNVYVQQTSGDPETARFSWQPRLPIATVGPDVTCGGAGPLYGKGVAKIKVNVSSFDDRGRVSLANNSRCQVTGETCGLGPADCPLACRHSRGACQSATDCSGYGRCSVTVTLSCQAASDCPANETCVADTCESQDCWDTGSRRCSHSLEACTTDASCPEGAGECSGAQAGRYCTLDSNCLLGEICQRGETCGMFLENKAYEFSPSPGPKQVIWTLNDASGYPISRKGIKIAWEEPADGHCSATTATACTVNANCPTNQTCVLEVRGYRVYRSETPGAARESWCALLQPGSQNPPGQVCPDANAYSQEFSSGPSMVGKAPTPFYWDATAEPERTYSYTYTTIASTGVESAFGRCSQTTTQTCLSSTTCPQNEKCVASGLATRAFDYNPQVPPPPSGFRAWAPSSGNDMSGIYLHWCRYPTPDPRVADPALPPQRFVVYRAREDDGPAYRYKVEIPAACLDEDPSGRRNKRCEILGPATTDPNGVIVYPTPTPMACGGTVACAIVDRVLPGCPSSAGTVLQQNESNLYYAVTAIGPNGRESVPSQENIGYPNYCSGAVRRDADGEGEYPVCGDERVSLEAPENTIASVDPAPTHEPSSDEAMAPYRIIGQSGSPDFPPDRLLFYHLDHLGSVRAIHDINGNLVSKHSFLPFGEERPVQAPASTNRRMFTGHEREPETGLDYMLARYYSSSLGRFMAVDPALKISKNLENPQRWNRYAYTLNNPLTAIDPDGREEIKVTYTTTVNTPTVGPSLTTLGRTFAGGMKSQQTMVIETDPSKGPALKSHQGVRGPTTELTPGREGTTPGGEAKTMQASASRGPDGSTSLTFSGNESNPQVEGSPGISYSFSFTVSPDGSFTLSGQHDGFPQHQMKVTREDGTSGTVLEHDPQKTGEGPDSLFGSGEHTVNKSGKLPEKKKE
jgi:RHS repeat-associated protein